MLCRHCGVKTANRPRGLCWVDFYDLEVRALYPPGSADPAKAHYARRGVGNVIGTRPLPETPTEHPPGSPEKVAVLEGRAALGQSLWHPADHDPDPRRGGSSEVQVPRRAGNWRGWRRGRSPDGPA